MARKNNNIRVSYAQAVYGKPETDAVLRVLAHPNRIVPGYAVKEFERRIARIFGKKYGVMVNSGSSANLLALDVLDFPKGSEIITPALTFATTVAPIIQNGLVPVFIDVIPGRYIVDVRKIEPLITKRTRALMIPSLLGNLPDFAALRRIAKKHNLIFIEDSCDTLGARFGGKPTGAYSDISTTSFYASHIITAAAAGGMVCFHNEALANRALVKSSWGRDSTLFGVHEKSEDIKKRFAGVLAGDQYDAKFIFSEMGYNFQSTELNAAFGLEQLKRFGKFRQLRKKWFRELAEFFRAYERFFVLPEEDLRADTAWLAFPLTIKEGTPFSRIDITTYLEKHNIQTRPIFTGNVLQQPGFHGIQKRVLKEGYPIADYIMRNGFVIGCHQGLTTRHMRYLKQVMRSFLSAF